MIAKKIDFEYLLCYNIFWLKGKGWVILRVISGKAKGRKLKVPAGWNIRPTPDRVKESLFNILMGIIEGARFLDLFAGTGNVGIEALSRGAAGAVFVENNSRHVKVIEENLAITGLGERARVIKSGVEPALKKLAAENLKFDIVFMDPPYHTDLAEKALLLLAESDLVGENGLVIVESSSLKDMPERVGDLFISRREKYGDTVLTFYAKFLRTQREEN